MKLVGAQALEQACGARYREEVTDLGLGFAARDMVSKLRTWGYDASREACQELSKHFPIQWPIVLEARENDKTIRR